MRKVLLTGFEAFGDTPINPAEKVAKHLDGAEVDGVLVVSRVVPNTFFTCIDVVRSAIEEVQPEAVVMMGEYGGRSMLTVERIAQNLNDCDRYQLLDNDGRNMKGEMTVPDGPAAYYATLPIRAMVRALRDAGIPSDISDVMGTFCCNHLLYGILHHLAESGSDVRAGWIHLPHLPEVAALDHNLGAPSMSVETAAAGLKVAIGAVLANPTDSDDSLVSRLQI